MNNIGYYDLVSTVGIFSICLLLFNKV